MTSETPDSQAVEPVTCLRHPDTETMLRCSTCGDPICPKCMVIAPVGVRCPSCVNYEHNPLVHIQTPYLVRGVAGGVGAGIAAGIILGLFLPFIGFFTLIIWAGTGYLIGQATSVAANRSRAKPLQYVAGGSAVLAFAIASVLGVTTLFALIGLVLAIATAISPFR